MTNNPKCFIAMAFNQEDTDALYENQIEPVLSRNGIKPIIINRQENNLDLNIQIIDQLKKCDFCIVDLTYARPSVYYEAGFAERSVSVIYTVRKDHLAHGQPENLRVHFDLQMKPLIMWSHPEDNLFKSKLERRIKATFLHDWNNIQRKKQQEEKDIYIFESLSQTERLASIRKTTILRLNNIGFTKWNGPPRPQVIYDKKRIKNGHVDGVYSVLLENDCIFSCSINTYQSAIKSKLLDLNIYNPFWDLDLESLFNKNVINRIKEFKINHYIQSIIPIPTSRIENVFTTYRPIKPFPIYYSISRTNNFRGEPIKVIVFWHFISGIKSENHLKKLLDNHINHLFTTRIVDQK